MFDPNAGNLAKTTILMALALLWMAVLPCSIASGAPAAETVYVDQDAPGGIRNGENWSTAYHNLQIAVDDATAGDEIWVANGTYVPFTPVLDRRIATFSLKDGVAIYGGFAGDESMREERDWQTNITVLSGDIDGDDLVVDGHRTIVGSNAYHVVTGNSVDTTAKLDGVTIADGDATGTDPNTGGGGLYNYNSSPTVANITFDGNRAVYGGGIYNHHSNPMLTNVTFLENGAVYGGGMLNGFSSGPTLTNVTFIGNRADGSGGGIRNENSNPILTDVTFSHNQATSWGGGMHNFNSRPTLTDVTFSYNRAGSGGGMYNHEGSRPALNNVTFLENRAETGRGGGMYNVSSNSTLTNVTFSNNLAGDQGGGLYNSNSSPTLTDITFSANSAHAGGGLHNVNSSPTLTNVTFTNNSVDFGGGGMYNGDNSNPTLTDITFTDNLAKWGGGMCNSNSSPTLTIVTFSSNHADEEGGGMYNEDSSSPMLTSVTFTGNSSWSGGGIYNSHSSPTLTDVTFYKNRGGTRDTSRGGGMFNFAESSPALANVTFAGNEAWSGGGMANSYSSPTLTNVTFAGSMAHSGGGMYNRHSSPTLTNVTIAGNWAAQGGGMTNYEECQPAIQNSIIWGNTAGSGPQVFVDETSRANFSYSLVEGLFPSGAGNLNGTTADSNPHFVRDADCGDDGCTDNPGTDGDEGENDDYGDLRLQPDSPAIDAGNNSAFLDAHDPHGLTIGGITTDLGGNPRRVAARSTTAIVDLGAYEAPACPLFLPVIQR